MRWCLPPALTSFFASLIWASPSTWSTVPICLPSEPSTSMCSRICSLFMVKSSWRENGKRRRWFRAFNAPFVSAGRDPTIHSPSCPRLSRASTPFFAAKTWMAGTSPAMTGGIIRVSALVFGEMRPRLAREGVIERQALQHEFHRAQKLHQRQRDIGEGRNEAQQPKAVERGNHVERPFLAQINSDENKDAKDGEREDLGEHHHRRAA